MSVPFVKQFDDFAEAMAEPNPNRPFQEAAAGFGRSVCDAISARPGTFAPTVLQSPLKAICQPYWDSQGYSAPVEVSLFTGGQCAGVQYRLFAASIQPNTGQNFGEVQQGTLTGPISLIQTGPDSPVQACDLPRTWWPELRWISGTTGGEVFARLNSCSNFAGTRNFRVARVDGLPDNCGNPQGELEPGPNPAPDPGPLPPGTGPSFDVRGNPILVLPPSFEFAPGVEIEFAPGEVNVGGGTGGGPAESPIAGDEEIGGGSGDGGGENDFGEPPDGERWVGCCVRITSLPSGSGTIPQSEPESIYPRLIGNVRLRFEGSDGLSEYDTPLVNRQKTTCIWEPVRGMRPTGVRVNLLPGYSYTYKPYSIPEEQ